MTSSLIDAELQQNAMYTSFNSFIIALQDYTSKHKVKLHRSDSHRINYKKMQPYIADEIIEKFTYSNMTYTCQYNRRKSRAKNAINDIRRENCKFRVCINLTSDNKYLKITRMCDPSDHNHLISDVADKLTSVPNMENVKPTVGQLDHMTSVMHQLSEFRKSGQFCDTVIMTHGGTLFAHSSILAATCPRLATYLNRHPISNSMHNNIDMTRYGIEEVQSLLEFFYEGHLNMALFDKIKPLALDLGLNFNVKGQGANKSTPTSKTIENSSKNIQLGGLITTKSKVASKDSKPNIQKSSTSISKLKRRRQRRIAKSHRCSDCGKLNQSRRELLLHRLVYCPLSISRIKEYFCKVCEAACKNIHSLHCHMNASHGVKKPKYKCGRCRFAYFYKRNLTSHQSKNSCVPPSRSVSDAPRNAPLFNDGDCSNVGGVIKGEAVKDPPLFVRVHRDSAAEVDSPLGGSGDRLSEDEKRLRASDAIVDDDDDDDDDAGDALGEAALGDGADANLNDENDDGGGKDFDRRDDDDDGAMLIYDRSIDVRDEQFVEVSVSRPNDTGESRVLDGGAGDTNSNDENDVERVDPNRGGGVDEMSASNELISVRADGDSALESGTNNCNINVEVDVVETPRLIDRPDGGTAGFSAEFSASDVIISEAGESSPLDGPPNLVVRRHLLEICDENERTVPPSGESDADKIRDLDATTLGEDGINDSKLDDISDLKGDVSEMQVSVEESMNASSLLYEADND